MIIPKGTNIDLFLGDPQQYVLGAVWECVSSNRSSSVLRITFPWGETRDIGVNENITATWYNPNNPNEWLSYWPGACSTSGTYGIANYGIDIPELKPEPDEDKEDDKKDNKLIMIILIILAVYLMRG